MNKLKCKYKFRYKFDIDMVHMYKLTLAQAVPMAFRNLYRNMEIIKSQRQKTVPWNMVNTELMIYDALGSHDDKNLSHDYTNE